MKNLDLELKIVKELALRVGHILTTKQKSKLEVFLKNDGSSVTNIDREISQLISKELKNQFPTYGILDEEINAETKNDERFDNDFCWFIDPLDGTISYIKNQDTYGVFIGLTHKLKPVLGVTYQPNLGELCYATKSNGAYIEKNNQKQILTVNKNTEIHTLTSYFRNDPELNKLLNKINPKTTTPMPSSLKTIEVAKGNYNLSICPRESYMNLWDFCAPQIILEEAGGKITDLCGNLIDYAGCIINKKGALASNGIIHENIIYKLKN